MPNSQKFGLLGSLYVSQYIPVLFLLEALPVFMRQRGMSLESIGLLSLLALPLTVNFLWSPAIDRYGFTRWGHYRFWIICFQLLAAGTTVVCAWLDVETQLTAVLIILFVLCFFCSSQDIATDALAVGLLEPNERGLGNGIQRGGAYLGSVIGGGGMLLLLNRLGWTATLLIMASLMVVALIPVFQHRERVLTPSKKNGKNWDLTCVLSSYFQTFTRFFSRPGIGKWLTILILYTIGSFMASTMFRPLLVDLGLSIAEIGLLLGGVSYTAAILGAIAAGFWIRPLGRKRSLLLFGLLETLATATYFLPAFGVTSRPFLYFAAIVVHLTGSMASTAMLAVMMDKSQVNRAGTDYTIQNSCVYLGGIGASALSGAIAEMLGYQGVFALGIAISLLSLALIHRSFDEAANLDYQLDTIPH